MQTQGPAIRYFNPDLLPKEDLVRGFIARQDVLERLVDSLRRGIGKESVQHHLLLGQRGAGKTTLLRRLAFFVEDDAELDDVWFALVFPEEQYNVTHLGRFWMNCLDALAERLEVLGRREEAAALDEAMEALGEKDGEKALQLLLREAERLGKRFLLLVDNFDQVLERVGKDEEWALRRVLQEQPSLCLIGASSKAMEASYDYGRAFYEYFQVHELRGLNDEEMFRYFAHLAGESQSSRVQRALKQERGKLRTIRLLTGGNPRTLALFFQILEKDEGSGADGILEQLLDLYTPLYKARFEELAQQAQVVVDAVALRWDPVSAASVAELTGLEVKVVSAQLARMEDLGLVEKVRGYKTKKAMYQIAERFFNIWYLMRSGRRAKKRLAWLTRFIESWYSQEERCVLAEGLMDRAGDLVEAMRLAPKMLAYADAIEDGVLRSRLELKAIEALVAGKGSTADLDERQEETFARMEAFRKLREEFPKLREDWGGVDPEECWLYAMGRYPYDGQAVAQICEGIRGSSIPGLRSRVYLWKNEVRTTAWMIGIGRLDRERLLEFVARGFMNSLADWPALMALGGRDFVYFSYSLALHSFPSHQIEELTGFYNELIKRLEVEKELMSTAATLNGDMARLLRRSQKEVRKQYENAIQLDPTHNLPQFRLSTYIAMDLRDWESGQAMLELRQKGNPTSKAVQQMVWLVNSVGPIASQRGQSVEKFLRLAEFGLDLDAAMDEKGEEFFAELSWLLLPMSYACFGAPEAYQLRLGILEANSGNDYPLRQFLQYRAHSGSARLIVCLSVFLLDQSDASELCLSILQQAPGSKAIPEIELKRIAFLAPQIFRLRGPSFAARVLNSLGDTYSSNLEMQWCISAIEAKQDCAEIDQAIVRRAWELSTQGWSRWMLEYVLVALRTKGAAKIREEMEHSEVQQELLPLYEAVVAIEVGDPERFLRLSAEVRAVAEELYRSLNSR